MSSGIWWILTTIVGPRLFVPHSPTGHLSKSCFSSDLRLQLSMCLSAGHGRKTGTNLYAALDRVNEVIGIFKEKSAEYNFNETQNIIIVATDGRDTEIPTRKRNIRHVLILSSLFYLQVSPTPGAILRLLWPRSEICWVTSTHPRITLMRRCWVSQYRYRILWLSTGAKRSKRPSHSKIFAWHETQTNKVGCGILGKCNTVSSKATLGLLHFNVLWSSLCKRKTSIRLWRPQNICVDIFRCVCVRYRRPGEERPAQCLGIKEA